MGIFSNISSRVRSKRLINCSTSSYNLLSAVRESLHAKTSRCAQLQAENERLRSRQSEITYSSPQRTADRPLSHELEVKEHQIKLLKSRYENLEFQLADKDRRLLELEEKISQANGISSRDEKSSAEAKIAMRALEDALSDKDEAMKR